MSTNHQDAPPTSATGAILRLHWMLLGNTALMFIAAMIASHKFTTLVLPSVVYWVVVVSLIVSRYFDIRHMHGETVYGRPATMDDLKRYSLLVVLFASVVWGIAIAVRR